MKKNAIRIFAAMLTILMLVSLVTIASSAQDTTKTVVDYNFATMQNLDGVNLINAKYNNGKDATWELKDGALVVKSTGGHALVQVHNFAASDNSTGFSIEMKVKFINSNGGKTRAGIAYGMDQAFNGTFTFFALKEGNVYSVERNVLGAWQGGLTNGTYQESTSTYEYALNREYTLRVDVDSENNATAYLDGVKTAAENVPFKKDGTGMGIYLRDADLAISSYTIKESVDATASSSSSSSSASSSSEATSNTSAVDTSKNVLLSYDFTSMQNLDSVTDIKLANTNYANGKDATWELKDGALVVKSTGGHALIQLHNFVPSENSAGFAIEMKVKFLASNGAKTRAGIAYGMDQEFNGTFSFFALKESNFYAIERNVKGTWQGGLANGTYQPNDTSVNYDYALNREYTLRVEVDAAGLATAYLDGQKTSAERIPFKNDGTGMGIYLRDSDLAISSYSITELLADPNSSATNTDDTSNTTSNTTEAATTTTTAEETTTSATTKATTTAKAKKGCGSFAAAPAVLLAGIAATTAIVSKKRRK